MITPPHPWSRGTYNFIELEPCDVLVCINDRKDMFSKIKRWAMGRYEHVEMYLGIEFTDIPLLVESDNRGVVIQNVAHQGGRHVRVMRPDYLTKKQTKTIIRKAVEIASNSKSSYDWIGLIRFAGLRVLRNKFGIKRPITYKYKRDPKMICSEAIAEMFWRSDINILPTYLTPIPEDFSRESHVLCTVNEGNLVIAQEGNSVKLFLDNGGDKE